MQWNHKSSYKEQSSSRVCEGKSNMLDWCKIYVRQEPQVNEWRQPLEAEKGKGMILLWNL